MEKICLQCWEKYKKKKTSCKKSWEKSMFCSMSCGSKKHQEEKSTKVSKVCTECKKEFFVQNYRKNTAKCCSSDCFHKSRNFGITTENKKVRSGKEFRKWRELVFERDDWTCKKCLIRSGNGRTIDLNPHHIYNFSDNEEIRFNIDNWITFCRKCHYDFHSEFWFRNNNKEQIDKFIT